MTEQAKHTPGPWKANKAFVGSAGQTRYNITGEDNGYSRRVIADTPFFEGHGEDIHAANAHLIAASPDLLEACKHVRNNLYEESPSNFEHEIAHLDYAITRAEGAI